MSYRALLFCADERTSRLLTQVLKDLDFSVEPLSEPFAAVKLLTERQFEAVVVDCDNEQNALLLFKSARNSGVSHTSLAVAVVEGQAGITKAFRIGANLVLTKPINVEQCKNTLRVARGLIRKAEAGKPAAGAPLPEAKLATVSSKDSASHSIPVVSAPLEAAIPAPALSASAAAPAAAATAPALSGPAWELEQEPTPEPGPAEAALLESMPDVAPPQATTAAAAVSKPTTWAPVTELSSLAADVTANSDAAPARALQPDILGVETLEPKMATAAVSTKTEPESKPATAIKRTASQASAEPVPELPRFATVGAKKKREVDAFDPAQSRKNFVIAAVLVLALAAVGYFAWTKYGSSIKLPFMQQQNAPAQPAAPPATPAPASSEAQTAPAEAPEASNGTAEAATVEPSTEATAAPAEGGASAQPTSPAGAKPAPATPAHEPLVVKNGVSKPVAKEAESAAPPAVEVNGPDTQAIAGIASASPTSLPAASLRPVKVSQGISQGLLIKKVLPAYPAQAKQLRLEGQVQLQANITKEGNISKVTVLAGNTTLARAAIDAVRQWKYKPYLLNGKPTDIETQITVNFKLP